PVHGEHGPGGRRAPDHPRHRGLRSGHRAVLGAGGRLHRCAGHHHAEGARLGSVAPGDHLPGGLDPAVGPGPDLRVHAGPPRRGARGRQRPHPDREGHAVGLALNGTGRPPLRIGMIGCGVIAAQYLATFDVLADVELVAVADLDPARAAAVADGREGVRALAVEELLADDQVDAVLNLTIPAAHAEIDLRAIAAGKHVYSEKPFAITTEEGRAVLEAAERAGVQVGSAPDTVLGTGTQTGRAAIDDGVIGTPVAAMATMVTPGHERWHPQPDYYYAPGGGPLLDMGPYYIHALVTLLGPVRAVIGASSRQRPERTIGSGPRAGEAIPVSTDTHVTGVLVHDSGVLSTLVMSFDAVATTI